MSEIDVIKWLMGLLAAAIVGVVTAVWKFPEKYVLKTDYKEDFNDLKAS